MGTTRQDGKGLLLRTVDRNVRDIRIQIVQEWQNQDWFC